MVSEEAITPENKGTIREEFLQKVDYLIEGLLRAKEYFDCYETIYNQQYENVKPLNVYPGFFQLCKQSFLYMPSVILAKMFDDNEKISLPKCRRILEQNWNSIVQNSADRTILAEYDQYLEASKDKKDKLKYIRDKLLAHNDPTAIHDDNLWATANMTVGDYWSLFRTAHEIIGILTMVTDMPTPVLGMGAPVELAHLVKIIESYPINKAEKKTVRRRADQGG